MKEADFRLWLSNDYRTVRGTVLTATTVNSRISNCNNVEQHESNLDHLFEQDRLQGLIDRLSYSRNDERQNFPARHKIPIDGNIYDGTATLKSAVSLYKQFRERGESSPIHPQTPNTVVATAITHDSKSAWPMWNQPDKEKILLLAHLTVPFVRFLHPDIVRAVVEDNERHREEWINALKAREIDPEAYLWDKSPCAFPGVRRYAGGREIAEHRGHALIDEHQNKNALALDDNNYPKQLWSFVFRGLRFSNFGPTGYALAHLADHKKHGNRFEQDFDITYSSKKDFSLFGLYTSPSNTVYIPVSLIRPTDFAGTIRSLLVRRAQELYGAFCKLLPPFFRIPEESAPEWNIREFTWAEPVGTTKYLQNFLDFRKGRLLKLITEHKTH